MAIVLCPEGHYYDNRKSETCPICEHGLGERAQEILRQHEKLGIKMVRAPQKVKQSFAAAEYDTTEKDIVKTEPTLSEEGDVVLASGEGVTLSSVDVVAENQPFEDPKRANRYDITEYGLTDAPNENQVKEVFTVPSYVESEEGLKKPIPFLYGWLVCIEGPSVGTVISIQDLELNLGLYPDRTVCSGAEAEEHPVVSVRYRENSNTFGLFIHNEKSAIRNDLRLQTEFPLLEGQKLCVGENLLTFVPFCKGENRWRSEQERIYWE